MTSSTFIVFFVFGTVVGSFFNVVIYRLPRGESLISPRSHCPHCQTPIPWYWNIPLLSYALLRGRCFHCSQRISIQYPIVEALYGFLWAGTFMTLPLPEALVTALLGSLLFAVAWLDSRLYLIPFNLVAVCSLILLVAVLGGIIPVKDALWGILVGVGVPLGIMGLTYLFTHRQGMGWGDLQLGFILGMWLGPLRMALTLFIASFLGVLVWFVIALVKGFDRNRPLPFAPYLIAGGFVSYFFGYVFNYAIDNLLMS
ncbi:MAG: prepilin peptidase [Fidelibacterota bacterium]